MTTLDYGKFLELCISRPPSGLGLNFKKGEADELFNIVDENDDGSISLDELMDYFRKEEVVNKMPSKKRIALVAHDSFKFTMVKWCEKWKNVLSQHKPAEPALTQHRMGRPSLA